MLAGIYLFAMLNPSIVSATHYLYHWITGTLHQHETIAHTHDHTDHLHHLPLSHHHSHDFDHEHSPTHDHDQDNNHDHSHSHGEFLHVSLHAANKNSQKQIGILASSDYKYRLDHYASRFRHSLRDPLSPVDILKHQDSNKLHQVISEPTTPPPESA